MARISPTVWYWVAVFVVLLLLNNLRLNDLAALLILLAASVGSLWFTWMQWNGSFLNFGRSSKKYVYWRGQRFELDKPKQSFQMPSLRSLAPVGLYVLMSILFVLVTLGKLFDLLRL